MTANLFGEKPSEEEKGFNPILKYVGIGLIVVALVVLIIFLVVPSLNSFTFNIEFNDAELLSEGAPLTLRGVKIGEVKNVQIESSGSALAKVSVQNKYASLLRQGSVFRLQSEPSGSSYIQISVLDPNSSQIESKSTIIGAASYLEYLEQSANIKGQEYLRKLAIGAIEVKTTLKRNSNINQRLFLITGELIPTDVLFSGILPEGDQWEREENISEGYSVIQLGGEFSDPNLANWANSTISHTKKRSLIFDEYTFEQVFPPESFQTKVADELEGLDTPDFAEIGVKIVICILDPSNITCSALLENISDIPALIETVIKGLGEQIGELSSLPLERVEINVVLNVPGKIIDHNGFEVTDEGVVWHLTGQDLNKGYTLAASYRVLNPWALLISVVILISLLCGIFYITVYKKRKDEFTDTPQEDQIF